MQLLSTPLPRVRHMLGFALILASAVAVAQPQTKPQAKTYDPPPDVTAKLRSRVNQFFQYHKEMNYKKAWTMVADDTQDYYFTTQKNQCLDFEIKAIRMENAEFTKAAVDVTCTQKMTHVEFFGSTLPVPMTTLWKVEEGDWKWYLPPTTQLTPMGESDLTKIRPGDKISPDQLRGLGDPKVVAEMGKQIISRTSIDKNEVIMALDKPSSVEVKFHNGQPGYVKLTVGLRLPMEGFAASVDKADVGPNEDAIIKLEYTPTAELIKLVQNPDNQVQVMIQPFNQMIPVNVRFK